ncbi:MAG: hypothetical protein ACJAVL_002091, partial [Bacteroidia bacterium]
RNATSIRKTRKLNARLDFSSVSGVGLEPSVILH